MITAKEAKALVQKYDEEMEETAKRLAETFAEMASDDIVEAANKGQTNIVIKVPNCKVRKHFVNIMTELDFDTETVKSSMIVKIIW